MTILKSVSRIASSCAALAFNLVLQLPNKSAYSLSPIHKHSSICITGMNMISSSSSTSGTTASALAIAQFLCRSDNYGYLVHDETTGDTAAIDTPSAAAYRDILQQRGWKLTHILNTHHHEDHTGGNLDLKQITPGVKIYGPASEKIPGMDVALTGGDSFQFGSSSTVNVIEVGGHTKGHIAYYFPQDAKLFSGDSLFALGCGRMFEGTPTQFWSSLLAMRSLPEDTLIYCGHEYTESNAKFALSVEPGNVHLQSRAADVYEKRSKGQPTVPSTIGDEKQTNPFFRVDVSEEIRNTVGVRDNDSDADAFLKVRRAKDNFRG